MFFSSESYAAVKKQMEGNLGRSQTSGKDFIAWKYSSDKKLNQHGQPSIRLSRDVSDKSSIFQLALEQEN